MEIFWPQYQRGVACFPSIEDKLDIVLEALTKRSETGTVQSSESRSESKEQIVVARAQRVAHKVNAEFEVVMVEPGKVVLDLGAYMLDLGSAAQLRRFARAKGVELLIVGGADKLFLKKDSEGNPVGVSPATDE